MQTNQFSGWLRQGIFAALISGSVVTQSWAQDPTQGGSVRMVDFDRLPPGIQQLISDHAPDLLQDATVRDAWRVSGQVCNHIGPGTVCRTAEGLSVGAGPISGELSDFGPNSVSVGASATRTGRIVFAPEGVGGTASSSYNLATGDVTVCAGPFVGVPGVLGVSAEVCATLDRQRAQDLRAAEAWVLQREAARRAEFSPSAVPQQTAYAQILQAEQTMREQAAANAYNPPAEFAGTQNAGQPTGTNRLVMDENAQAVSTDMRNRDAATNAPQTPEPEMTQEQFRMEVARQMQRFQAEVDRQRQELMQRQLPESSATEPVARPNQPQPVSQPARPQVTYAPRNGYDAYGNRADSPRQPLDAQGQYDEQGYRSQPRQNRVYGTDGSSRPIGNSGFSQAQQQFQRVYQQSQAQIGAMQSGRLQAGGRATSNSVNAPSNRLINDENATNVSSTSQSPSRAPAPRQTIVFDENAPRSTPTQVVPRQSGSSAATASLDFFPR